MIVILEKMMMKGNVETVVLRVNVSLGGGITYKLIIICSTPTETISNIVYLTI